MSATDEQQRGGRSWPTRILRAILYWVWWLYVYIAVTVFTGALIGAFLFLTVGALTHPDMDVLRRVEMGLMDGFYYSGMWSGGLAIVLCVMRAHRLHERRSAANAVSSVVKGSPAGTVAAKDAPAAKGSPTA